MANWLEFEAAAPELAAYALRRLDAHKHKTIATLRADGSPRISGIEITVADGELWIGGMVGSRKLADLRRDGRFALHSGSDDPAADGSWAEGDAKLSGVAVEVFGDLDFARFSGGEAPTAPFELFRADLREVSTVRVAQAGDHLVVDFWKPGEAVRRMDRY